MALDRGDGERDRGDLGLVAANHRPRRRARGAVVAGLVVAEFVLAVVAVVAELAISSALSLSGVSRSGGCDHGHGHEKSRHAEQFVGHHPRRWRDRLRVCTKSSGSMSPQRSSRLAFLINEIRACMVCAADLPMGPRPILAASEQATILIAGQAPGAKVHASGVPWDDASGDTLRAWMDIDRETFYDVAKVAIVPMGFCYPGKGSSGDLPPRAECATHWHGRLMPLLTGIKLTLVIGAYAQDYHLGPRQKPTLTETVQAFREYLPSACVLPHPSPRNRPWLTKNPWFERECLPLVRKRIATVLR